MQRPALKRFGQHFLAPEWVVKVIKAIAPKPDDDFFEIGPGRGALTAPLAAGVRSLTAFEIDRGLAADLRASAPSNLEPVLGASNDSGVKSGAVRRMRDAIGRRLIALGGSVVADEGLRQRALHL